jgi:hypothetical protein
VAVPAARFRGPVPTLAIVTIAVASGCDTISSDLDSFGESFSPPTPLEAATWAVDTTDAENQRRGVALLASAPWGGAEAYVRLYRLYVEENSDPLVKAFALKALGRHGDASDAKLVATQLPSPFKIVRLEAARSLQRLHDPAVADLIWPRLLDPAEEAEVRLELAVALGQYPTDSVFQALVAALDQRELGVNWAALDSLETLTSQDHGLDKAAWISWKDATSDAFVDEETYLYPVFRRELDFIDYVVFWQPVVFEDPGVPIGMRLTGIRRTYEGEAPPPGVNLPSAEAASPPATP